MKKGLIIGLAAALVIALGATFAFAESTSADKINKDQMKEMHKKMVEQHVKDGVLTPEQAKDMENHMANMDTMMKGMMDGSMMSGNANCHSTQQSTTAIPQQ